MFDVGYGRACSLLQLLVCPFYLPCHNFSTSRNKQRGGTANLLQLLQSNRLIRGIGRLQNPLLLLDGLPQKGDSIFNLSCSGGSRRCSLLLTVQHRLSLLLQLAEFRLETFSQQYRAAI